MPSKIDFLVANLRHENRTRPTARSPDPMVASAVFFRNNVARSSLETVWKPTEILGFC
jgi:hypothetical protein